MKYFKNGSFFLEQSKAGDRVEISDERFNELFSQQADGKEIYTDIAGYPQVRDPIISEATRSGIEIQTLKDKLTATDYMAIKFAEGELTEEEYAQTRAERKKWRARINELEGTLGEEV